MVAKAKAIAKVKNEETDNYISDSVVSVDYRLSTGVAHRLAGSVSVPAYSSLPTEW